MKLYIKQFTLPLYVFWTTIIFATKPFTLSLLNLSPTRNTNSLHVPVLCEP